MSAADRDEVAEIASKEVQALYTELAMHPEKDFGWGKGKENARALGYDTEWLDRLPDQIWESAAAVGNPFRLGPIRCAETVVDLGCGTGADLCIAAFLVGDEGRAVGIEITPAMVVKAGAIASLAGLTNVEVHQADMVAVPLEDGCADIVISNGSINLSGRKPCVFKEVFRILRPGGRFQFADMVKDSSAQVANTACSASWADCVAGTVEVERYLDMLRDEGFEHAEFMSFTGYRTAPTTVGACFRARKPRHRPSSVGVNG